MGIMSTTFSCHLARENHAPSRLHSTSLVRFGLCRRLRYRAPLVEGAGASLAKNVFLNLARGGLGEFRQECELLRHLKVGEAGTSELSQFGFRYRSVCLQDYEGLWSFTPTLVSKPYDAHLLDRRVTQQRPLHLHRRNVLTA